MQLELLDPVWFRLLKWPPFEVVFQRKVYRLELLCRLQTGDCWSLIAELPGGYVGISEDFRERGWLEDALIDGFATRYGTQGEQIMLLCVRLNYACPMPQPQYLPAMNCGKPWSALGKYGLTD